MLHPNIEKEREPLLFISRTFSCVFKKRRESVRWETKLAREASSPLLGTMIFGEQEKRRGIKTLNVINERIKASK